MSKVSPVSVHVDQNLKRSAEGIFQSFGMTPSEAIELFYQQVAQSNDLPFELKRKMGWDASQIGATNIIELYSSPDDDIMLREEAIFRKNQAHYQELYPDEFIAIHKGKVVDHDHVRAQLMQRRMENYGDKIVLVRHVNSDPDEVITIRSHIII